MEDQKGEAVADTVSEQSGMAAATPAEAPAKKVLSPEEQANHTRMVVRQGIMEDLNEMKALTDTIKEKGFQDLAYSDDSVVEISGTMFAHIANFMDSVEKHNHTVQVALGNLTDASNHVRLGALDFQVYLTKKHIENCEKGIAKTRPDVDKIAEGPVSN